MPEDVQLYYQIAVTGRRDLPWAPDPRLGFEMTLLRMLAFRPDDGGQPLQAAGSGSAQLAPAGRSAGVAPAAAVAAAPGVPRPAPAAAPVAAVAPSAPAPKLPAPSAPPLPVDAPWDRRVEALGLEGFTKQLARHCAWVGREGARVRLSLDARLRHLLSEDRRHTLEQALSAQLGETLALQIDIAMEAVESPALLEQQRATERQRAAEAAAETDPVVRAFRELFGATLRPGSVQPLDS